MPGCKGHMHCTAARMRCAFGQRLAYAAWSVAYNLLMLLLLLLPVWFAGMCTRAPFVSWPWVWLKASMERCLLMVLQGLARLTPWLVSCSHTVFIAVYDALCHGIT